MSEQQRSWPGKGLPGPFLGYRTHSEGLVISHEDGPLGPWSIVAGTRIPHRLQSSWDIVDQVAQAAYRKGLEDGKRQR